MTLSSRFIAWLEKRPQRHQMLDLLFSFWTVQLAWAFVIGWGLAGVLYVAQVEIPTSAMSDTLPRMLQTDLFRTVLRMFFGITYEEFFTRLLPIAGALYAIQCGFDRVRTLVITVLIASAVFGAVHVVNYYEYSASAFFISLVMQGGMGVIIAVLFLKYCGLQLRYTPEAFFVCLFYHFFWNLFQFGTLLVRVTFFA